MQTPEELIDGLFGLFRQFGGETYIGEAISQLEHACQVAQLAEQEGFDDEVVLAALFHDIGHLCAFSNRQPRMGDYGVMEHEKLGADKLRQVGFSERMTRLVESHVAAKRYLCHADPAYFAKLSDASVHTLAYQGGPMTAEEAEAFERDPLFTVIIRMRHWDEQAKEMGRPLADMERYRNMALRLTAHAT